MARDRSLSVRLSANVASYVASMKEAANSTRAVMKSASESATKNKAEWENVGRTVTAAGLVMAAGMGVMVKKTMDFEAAMSGASAATQAGAEELGKLREAAIRAGADTQYSATEAAQAITEMGKAGVSTADILGGGLKGALDLAASGQLEVGQAAEVAATAMSQFGLAGDQMVHVADLYAAAAGKAQGSVMDVGNAMKYVGPVAKSLGVSIEETTGVVAELAHAGIIGEQAGTSFRGMLLSLTSPSKAAQEQLDALGIAVYDGTGKFAGMAAVAEQFKTKLGTLSEAERNAALGRVFGNEQITAATVLYEGGASAVQDWTTKVNDAGFAARQAAQLTDNLKGDLERLSGSIDTALIKSGSAANDTLRAMTKRAEGTVDAFSRLPGPVQAGAVALGAVATATALAGGAFMMAVPKIRAFEAAVVEAGIVSQATATKILAVAKNVGIVTAAVGTLAVVGDQVQQTLNSWQGIDADAVKSLDAYVRGGRGAADVTGLMRSGFNDLGGSIERVFNENAWIKVSNFADAVMFLDGSVAGEAIAFFGQLDKAMAGFVANGRGQEAAGIFRQIADEASRQGIPIERLSQAFPQYTAALKGAVASTGEIRDVGPGSVRAWDAQSDAMTRTRDAAKAAEMATKDFIDGIKAMADPTLDARESQRQWEEAIDAATEALRRNGKTLDEGTEKGRANGRALDAMAKSALGNMAAMQANGASQAILQAELAKSRAQLEQAAIKFGMTKEQARLYADQVLRIPQAVQTKATLDTSAAMAAAAALAAEYRSLGRLAQIAAQQASSIERAQGHAAGGLIIGPGTKTSDSIPAYLSRGEYVVRAAAVDKYGVGMLDRINAMRFAAGGYVPPPSVSASVAIPSDGWSLSGSIDVGGMLVPLVDGRIRHELTGQARAIARGRR